MEQLIIGETNRGTYYVRPLSWAGVWDKDGRLCGCNTLYESKAKGLRGVCESPEVAWIGSG